MKFNRILLVIPLALLLLPICWAADQTTPENEADILVIKLGDFKMKPDKAITNPQDVFFYDDNAERLCMYTNLAAEAKFKLKTEGKFDIVIAAAGDSAMDVKPKFKVELDDQEVGKEVSLKSDSVKTYRLPITLKAGEHKLSIAFTNDLYKQGEYDSNLYVHGVKITPHRPELADKDQK